MLAQPLLLKQAQTKMHQVNDSLENILVIADRLTDLQLLITQLKKRGYQICLASSVDFTSNSIRSKQPDLILLTVETDESQAYKICQTLKTDSRTCHVPVIFLSETQGLFDQVKAFEVGGADCITKPFETRVAISRIEHQLKIYQSHRQLTAQNNHFQQALRQHKIANKVLKKQLQTTVLLQQITETIHSQIESQTIFETVVEQIGRFLQVNRCSIHIYVPPPIPELPLVAEYVEPEFVSLEQVDFIPADNLFIPKVLSEDHTIASSNVHSDVRLQSIQAFCDLAGVQSLLVVRTSYQNQANGVITLQQCDQQREWTASEIALVEAIAAQVGVALAQAKAAEQEQKQLEALGYQSLLLRQEICERREMELALQASEAELQCLFAAMPDVILVLDRKGRYLKIAPTNQSNLYKPTQELLGKTLHEIFPQAQADQFLDYIHRSLDTQEIIDFEYSLWVQGQTVWFSAKVTPINQNGVLWVARDITTRKQAEAEVQLLLNITQEIAASPDFNQALYVALRALCEVTGWIYGEVWLPSADGVLRCSPVWYCRQAGQSAAAINAVKQLRQQLEEATFQPNEGIAGRVWSRQQPEWTLDVENLTRSPTFLTGETSEYRFQLVNHYGIKARLGVPITVTSDCPTNQASNAAQQGNSSTVLAVLVFFTVEARQQEQHLIQLVSAVAAQLGTVLAQKQAEAELQALFTAMSDVVLVRDTTGRCLRVASTNLNLHSAAASIPGKTLHETLPQPIADRLLQGIQASLARRTTVNLEYCLLSQNREVCLSTSISPLADDSVLMVARDISGRKRVEETLAKRERYLAVLVEVQRELLTFREQKTQYTNILQLLGQVTAASQVYLYEIHHAPGEIARTVRQAIWYGDRHKSQASALPSSLFDQSSRWTRLLAQGEIINGAANEFPDTEYVLLKAEGILSILVLPLLVNGEFWGFIGFDDRVKARTWDTLEISLLRTAASAITLHHEHRLAEEALRLSAEREQATLRVIERMRQTLNIEQIFRTTAEELRELLKCNRVLIYRFNSDWCGEFVAESVDGCFAVMQTAVPDSTSTIDIHHDHHDIVHHDIDTWKSPAWAKEIYLQDAQAGVYSQGAKYQSVQDIQQAKLSNYYFKFLQKLQARAYLTVPIFQGNRLWGLLTAYQNLNPRDWQPSEVHLVIHISTQLGVALQQADLLAQTQKQAVDLEKARDAAEAANRAKSLFLANMTHELRTPLNSILGFTQLISQEATLTSEHQNYLNIVNRSGQHLLELINAILEVARLETNRVSLQNTEFDFYCLLDEIEQTLRQIINNQKLRFSLFVASDVPRLVTTDRNKLRQVLINLLKNAIKGAQTENVMLRVAVKQNKQKTGNENFDNENFSNETDNEHPKHKHPNNEQWISLHFEIEEPGHGAVAEQLDSLFDAFTQAEPEDRSTSLALAISRQFVQLMGGQFEVGHISRTGTVTKFNIPIQAEFVKQAEQLEVHCIYEETIPSATHASQLLTSADLKVMPVEWLNQICQAASGCSDRQVLELLEQIPPAYIRLARSLEELVYNFRFEEIVELTKTS